MASPIESTKGMTVNFSATNILFLKLLSKAVQRKVLVTQTQRKIKPFCLTVMFTVIKKLMRHLGLAGKDRIGSNGQRWRLDKLRPEAFFMVRLDMLGSSSPKDI